MSDFTGCADLTVIFSGGTDYSADFASGYRDLSVDPQALARQKVRAAARHAPDRLGDTHIADYRHLFDAMTLSLGTSTDEQRGLDTWTRLQARAEDGAAPDPELEAAYLQFGRYLMICGSRDSVPMGLQAAWIDTNSPGWMGDYHTDVNIQMNYWMADRTGLPGCFDALTDYCLAQLPAWTDATVRLFNDPRNRFRNSSGKVAGWTVGISTNIHGGSGWQWHPAGSAWLANTIFEHYEYTQDTRLLARHLPAAQGRLRVLGGPAAHDRPRPRHRAAARGPRERQGLVARARTAGRPGHHLRAGTGVDAVRQLPHRECGARQGQGLPEGRRRPA